MLESPKLYDAYNLLHIKGNVWPTIHWSDLSLQSAGRQLLCFLTCSVSKNLRKRLYVWQKENPAWPGRTERKAGGGR